MANLPTPTQLRAIRDEIGTSPDDSAIEDLWIELQSVPAVALAVLRPRLADALNSRAVTIPGAIGVGAAPSPKYLDAQIVRLEAQLAAETGDADTSGLGATSLLAGRTDRAR